MNEEHNIQIESKEIRYFEECVICYNGYNINDGIIFDCSHSICLLCYQKLLNNTLNSTCPLCRKNLEVIDANKQVLEYKETEQKQVSEPVIPTIHVLQNNSGIMNYHNLNTYNCVRFILVLIMCLIMIFMAIKDYIK